MGIKCEIIRVHAICIICNVKFPLTWRSFPAQHTHTVPSAPSVHSVHSVHSVPLSYLSGLRTLTDSLGFVADQVCGTTNAQTFRVAVGGGELARLDNCLICINLANRAPHIFGRCILPLRPEPKTCPVWPQAALRPRTLSWDQGWR